MKEKIWHAVYTKPKWEKKVSELLTKRKIENFCPLNKVVRQWADRKKTIMEPLFTSYVFVNVCKDEYAEVKKTEGIFNFVYWLGLPAVVKNEEITAIQNFLSTYENVKLEKIRVNVSDVVKIISGPFTSKEGEVLEVKNNAVKILLPSLGYTMTAEVKFKDVKVIHYSSSEKQNNIYINSTDFYNKNI